MFTRLSPAFAPDDHGLVSMYRAAQKARIARITAGVRQRLEDFAKAGSDQQEHGFVVHGTMADHACTPSHAAGCNYDSVAGATGV
jgi:hypothetical protein